MTLSWDTIVDALGGESVWRKSFGREFLTGHVSRGSWRASLGWGVIDHIMKTTTIEPMMIRLSADPVAYPGTYISTRIDGGDIVHRNWRYGAMVEYLRSGATLVANRADRLHVGPARLREEFEYFADDPAWVNCYACWTMRSAFGRHADGHATVIFQAEGSKRWRIWEGSGPDARLVEEADMRAGDVWHVPRGWDHEATGTGPSLHWTFGVHVSTPEDLTRTALDAWSNRTGAGDATRDDGGVLDSLMTALATDVHRAREVRSAQSLERREGLSLPWSVESVPYTGTLLRWAARFPPLVEYRDGRVSIESLGVRLAVDGRLAPWVKEWSAGRATRRDDTAGLALTDAELDAALDTLVRAGLLLVEQA
ncbi:Cupin superfamily protein [Nonomuraea coxensis DSM 45129]|uniref:Cupin superfamily protein n=1 Tax=Nonomuraea coxensis DSM 45129 TaxID=1122611 RepID=A0ABX8TWE6_9ACTN|nr:cupin domain-containing protein [Nonomuraea coxensis]QYC39031.1 Cupin superfamily protein [Nonomuraea coxensis DSM 45129]